MQMHLMQTHLASKLKELWNRLLQVWAEALVQVKGDTRCNQGILLIVLPQSCHTGTQQVKGIWFQCLIHG